MHLDPPSCPIEAPPSRAADLPPGREIRQSFGAWRILIGVGLLVTAALLAIGEDRALGVPKGPVSEGAFVASAALCFALEMRRRRRRLTLTLRSGEVELRRTGAPACVRPITVLRSILLDAGATARNILVSLGAAAIPAAAALRGPLVARAAGLAWSAAFAGGTFSIVRMRLRSRHFVVPVDGRDLRIAVGAADGDALLAALPRTGNWQVAE